MSELEPERKEPEEHEDSTTAYTTAAVGVALLVAAVLVIITAGTPAAGIGFVIGAAACLGWSVPRLLKQRSQPPALPGKEGELLAAIRGNGGGITPVEAAMETSLTVREADEMLSELAGAGHLLVQSKGGTLIYELPNSRAPKLEGRAE